MSYSVGGRLLRLVLLCLTSLSFLQEAMAQESAAFYKWEGSEARDAKLLDAQVSALTTKRFDPLAKFQGESASERFAGIVTTLTAAVIRGLSDRVSFDRGGASAFGIWLQVAAQNLENKGQTNKERLKTTMVQARGFIFWLEVDDNLNLINQVKITEQLVKQVHDAFCPLYPFC